MKYISLLMVILALRVSATEDPNSKHFPGNTHPVPTAPSLPQANFHTLLGCIKISNENHEKCGDKLISVVNTLMVSPKACELLNKIERLHGTIELCFPTETSTGANWINSRRMISIKLSSANDILKFCELLLWELCNAGNELLEIPTTLIEVCGNQDIYSFLVEFCEYKSVLKRNEILKDYFDVAEKFKDLKESLEREAKSKISIDDMSDELLSQFGNFMDYWTCVNMKEIGRPIHADLYRKQYQDIVHGYTIYGNYNIEGFDSTRILTPESRIGNDAESLIVEAFSQQSFSIAQKEQKLLGISQADGSIQSRGQTLADALHERRKDQLIILLIGLYIRNQK